MEILNRDILREIIKEKKANTHYYDYCHGNRLVKTHTDLERLNIHGHIIDVGGTEFTSYLSNKIHKNILDIAIPDKDLELEDWSIGFENMYDFALCTEVIEHLAHDPAMMVFLINKVLKMNAIAYITTVNATGKYLIMKALAGISPQRATGLLGRHISLRGRHNKEYAPHEIGNLFAANGFKVCVFTENMYLYKFILDLNKKFDHLFPNLAGSILHNDTIIAVATKIEEIGAPIRPAPLYNARYATELSSSDKKRYSKNITYGRFNQPCLDLAP